MQAKSVRDGGRSNSIGQEASGDLGKLIRVYGTSAEALQRAVIVAVTSFGFFLTTLIGFYVSGRLGLFILSSAFLVVYVFTLVGILIQKRSSVRIFESGIAHRKFSARWEEISLVDTDAKSGLMIAKINGESATLGPSTAGLSEIAQVLRNHLRP